MKQTIKNQSETIQEMKDHQENITLANKERDEQLEEIRKLTESLTQNRGKSDELHSVSSLQSSFVECASDKTIEKIKTLPRLSETDERYLIENQLLGDFSSFIKPMMDRRNGHTGKDIYLVLKALQTGKECVNFKLDYIRSKNRVGEYRTFLSGNDWLTTDCEKKEGTRMVKVGPNDGYRDGRTHTEQSYSFLGLYFGLQLPFSTNIELSALINENLSHKGYQPFHNNLTLKYVFKNKKLVAKASGKGFLYELKDNSVEILWNFTHASVTWVIKILPDE